MSVQKMPNGRFRARIKAGRIEVATRVFDLKRDAEAWEAKQRRALDLGEFVDPRAGRETLESAWERWLNTRTNAVSGKTLAADRGVWRHIPPQLRKRPLSAIAHSQFDRLWEDLLGTHARGSVVRYRSVIGTFFEWARREMLVIKNPALESVVPRGRATKEAHEVHPFNIDELRHVHRAAVERAGSAAGDIVLVLGLTGLRWGELAALQARDVHRRPVPALRVRRSKSDGQPLRYITKGGKQRLVPLLAEARTIIEALSEDREPEDLLFPSRAGSFRDLANWKREVAWKTISAGRRVHDLRHTAATFWISEGTDLKTVQNWLGHATATLTADTYSHYRGTQADLGAVQRLNEVLAQHPDSSPDTSGKTGLQ